MIWMRLQLIVVLTSIFWLLFAVKCEAQETRCLTATELNEVTDYLCSRARQKEVQYDKLRLVADDYLVRAVSAEAKLQEYRSIDLRRVELERELALVTREKDERVSKIRVVLYVVGGVVLGGVVGYGVKTAL